MKIGQVLAVAAGALAGYMLAEELLSNRPDKEKPGAAQQCVDFGEFQKNQAVYDTLDGTAIMLWFHENRTGFQKPLMLLIRPTDECLRTFHIVNAPKEIDAKTNLLQVICDGEHDELKARLISFSSMTPKVSNLFCDQDYVIVKEE